ncbi:MAG TPA: hypothetical protein VI431_08250 [Candidatus Acidoferrum sp.]
MKKLAALTLLLFLTTGMALADTRREADPKPAKAPAPAKPTAAKKAEKSDTAIAAEIEELRQAIQSQQEQLQLLKEELAKRDRQIDEAREAAAAANARAAEASAKTNVVANTAAEVKSTPAALNATVSELKESSGAVKVPVSAATALPAQGNEGAEKPSPLFFRIGSANFTPGGFMDFTSIFRSTNVGSGIGTSFAGIPYNNTVPAARLTELRFSPQNSRVFLKVEAPVSESTNVTGYVEGDFLGFQPPNVFQSSNSDSFRLRLYWADVRHAKWEVLAGEAWTLLTPNRVGLSPMPADIFYSQDMDTNYQLGLTWARQTAFRVIYHPSDTWAVGVSVENPQQFAPTSVIFPNSSFAAQLDNGSGNPSSATAVANTSVPNVRPDIIVKSAWDWKWRERAMHLEVAGLSRSFKVFNNLASPATTNTIEGGGGSLNFNLELVKNFRLIGTSFYSCGGGRYIFGLGPDVIVKANGTLSCVHAGSGIGGIEWQATPKLMVYGYDGAAYFGRNWGFVAAPLGSACPAANPPAGSNCVGYGFPGSSNSANRVLQEPSVGFVPTLWKNPNHGALQVISQFSYVLRSPWFVAAGAPKNAHTTMVYLDVRYVLP